MSVNNKLGNLVRLGDCIELCDERNSNLIYGFDDVRDCSNNKEIQPTKADISNRSFDRFLVIHPNEFVFNRRTTRMGERLGLGYNSTKQAFIFTEDYVGFRIKDDVKLLPDYLYIYFLRTEFDRYVRYDSWGSATEFFNWDSMCEVKISLPNIEIQQELVDTFNGLKALAEQNEALIKPLTEACQAYIVDCKKKYPEVELGEYIEPCDERNSDGKYTLDDVRGISILKKLIPTKADMQDVSLSPYKLLKPREFSYVTVTSRNGGKISLALNDSDETFLVSSSYEVYRSKNAKELLPEYLYLILSREEFDRFSRFNSWGSARETFDWSEICRVLIPLPPPEVQQAIVNIYNCAEEAKKIANEAREKMKTLCPALVQRAING